MASVDLTGADRFSVRGWEFEQWVGSICPTKSNFRFARDKIWICRWLWQALQLHYKQIILIELRQNCKGVLDKGHIDICNKATNRKTTVNETFLLWHFSWDQQRAITLMNLVPANQFGSHFLNHKNRNWKHMHQTKWHKLQNILCQKYDKNSRLFSFQRNMIKSWKPMAPHCWAVFMSQVWQSPKMDSWNFSRSVHITRIWIFTMLEECLHYKMNICQK